jgi:hypothetical protein
MSSDLRRRLARLDIAIERFASRPASMRQPRDHQRAAVRRAIGAVQGAIRLLTEIRQKQDGLPSKTEP